MTKTQRFFRMWVTNRVIAGMVIFFIGIGMWEFKWKPQYRPYYEAGITDYQRNDFQGALNQFSKAYEIAPNSLDVIVMMGWANLKLKHFEDARFYFNRAIRIDPRTEEAQMGATFVALETGRGDINYRALERIIGKRNADPNVRILLAGALAHEGRNFDAAEQYMKLVDDRNYSRAAHAALDDLFGLQGFSDPVPRSLPRLQKAPELQVRYRASDGQLWELKSTGWQPFYVRGVNLGPGAPGYYPAKPPHDGMQYLTWLRDTQAMNANVIRAYTLLPPAFYRAFRHQMDAGVPLTLYQQIWVDDPPNKDLYDPSFVDHTKAEIRYVVDALHGHGDVPPKHARGSGVYDQDVSQQVSGILLGREIEPSVAQQTNIINGGKTHYDGKFITVKSANATEVWFAEMLDYLVEYENDTYNWQHPVAIVNWPPMDPLTHPTEATTMEEVKYRMKHGEVLAIPKELQDDNDIVAIDEAKFSATTNFYAGIFASYHVYPYYPDFLLQDKNYLSARDSEGLDPMYGYIKELRAHIPHPLVITEYGMPNSMGISHFHPYGWNHGGHNEQDQAELLGRYTRAIHEAGCAGGIVFELVDEWYKHNWLTVDFENPLDNAALWLNDLDPEKRYGVIGYHTSGWKLFTSDAAAWKDVPQLYPAGTPILAGDGYDGARTIRNVQATVDEGYLYLRLEVVCLDCTHKNHDQPDFTKAAYAVAINTLPGHAGIQKMPFGNITLTTGANFLLVLGTKEATRLYVADDYNPYIVVPKEGVPGETELVYRRNFQAKMVPTGSFEEEIVETNRKRYGRDGTAYPGQRYSRSILRYGNGDPNAPDYDSLGEWYADTKAKAILVRIPLGKLFITDPSSRQVFLGLNDKAQVGVATTPGITLSVFALKPGAHPDALSEMQVEASRPAALRGRVDDPQRLLWRTWLDVKPDPYFKKAYYELQKDYLEVPGAPNNAPAPVPAVRTVRTGTGTGTGR